MFAGTRAARVVADRARRPAKRLCRAAPARGADRFGISRGFLALRAPARLARVRGRSLPILVRSAKAKGGWCASAWSKRRFLPVWRTGRAFASLDLERLGHLVGRRAICM